MTSNVPACAVSVLSACILFCQPLAPAPMLARGAMPAHLTPADVLVCPVTQPNGRQVSGDSGGGNHGNDGLVTWLWREGTIVFKPGGAGYVLPDQALSMKFGWWRLHDGSLTIEGRRLDSEAPPLRASIPNGYGPRGFQATALIFPTPGCWEVTGRVGSASLTFVTRVEKIGEGPGHPPR